MTAAGLYVNTCFRYSSEWNNLNMLGWLLRQHVFVVWSADYEVAFYQTAPWKVNLPKKEKRKRKCQSPTSPLFLKLCLRSFREHEGEHKELFFGPKQSQIGCGHWVFTKADNRLQVYSEKRQICRIKKPSEICLGFTVKVKEMLS